ncbi:putative repeat protein (TIGR02543 family) [Ereboglobus sp. PH5-5]|uniref:InlB B-repeat-containing protein n=1 Tax=Ereboglobus sp. PH5-5 TaxID=2940529 RepID=UPI002406CC6D|nr:InlB B-repeat-containing protein [Ereboglobus sp. PH5-5]MDF9832449.1 putative repeat protein (TIGR02543 family) [Ereboglobus sp. PH5-5]
MKSTLTLLIAFILAISFAPAIRATDVYWDTGVSGSWFTPNGWRTGSPSGAAQNAPTENDAAFVTDGNIAISNGITAVSGSSFIGYGAGASGTLAIAGGGVWTNTTSNNTYIGYEGTGVLKIDQGGVANTNYLQIAAKDTTSSGTVIVDGYLNNRVGMLYVGGVGDGTLIVGQTGTLYLQSSFRVGGYNSATSDPNPNPNFIKGAGNGIARIEGMVSGLSRTIAVGFDGKGRMDVTTTGTIKNNNIYVGDHGGASGTANLGGYWESAGDILRVGASGTGVFNIQPTGTFIGTNSAATTSIAHVAQSTGTLNVEGFMSVSGDIRVSNANAANGTLKISGTLLNNTVGARRTYLAYVAGANATVNMEPGALFVTGSYFLLGRQGSAEMTVAPGAAVHVGTYSQIGDQLDSSTASPTYNQPTGRGTLRLAGLWSGSAHINIGNSANGYVEVLESGTLLAGTYISIAQGTKSSGTAIIRGYMGIGDHFYMGVGTANVHIAQTGTIVTGLNGSNGYVHLGRNAAGSGTMKVDGLFDLRGSFQTGYGGKGTLDISETGAVIVKTYSALGSTNNSHGTANVAGIWANTTHFYLGRNPTVDVTSSGTGILNILPTGIVTVGGNFIAAADANAGKNTAAGVTSTGTASVAGLLNITGKLILGQLGDAHIHVAPTGSVIVGGDYSQNAQSSLAVTLGGSRDTPCVTVSSAAALDGALRVDGLENMTGYATAASATKASDLPSAVILRATGGIKGNFASVTTATALTGTNGMPDYIFHGKNILNATEYHIGHLLAWRAPAANAHGTFTIASGKTFTIDTPLANRADAAALATGWDGKSLAKKGPGTLVLAAAGTRTGDTTIESGTLRVATPSVALGNLVNNATLDLGGGAAGGYHTAEAASLAGSGVIRLAINPSSGIGDRLVIRGNASGAQGVHITIDGSQTGPLAPELLANLITVQGVNNAIFTGNFTYNGETHSFTQQPDGGVSVSNATIAVTFDAQGGALNGQPASKAVPPSQPYGPLPRPSRAGYVFSGWWTGSGGGGSLVSPDTIVTNSIAHTLYARWISSGAQPSTAALTVTFSPQGGAVSPLEKTVHQNTAYGELPAPTRAGATFSGWFTAPSGGTQVTAATNVPAASTDHILYARWATTSVTPSPEAEIHVRPVPNAPGVYRVVSANLRGNAGGDAEPSKTKDIWWRGEASIYHGENTPYTRNLYPRRAVLRETILALNADIVCCQEVTWEQLDDLLAVMPGYAAFKYPINNTSPSTFTQGNGILYSTEKFELLDKDHFWSNKHPRTPGLYPTINSHRDASWVKLRDKKTGREFVVWNTHLQHNPAEYGPTGNNEARLHEIRLVLQAASLHHPDTPQLLFGDFNVGYTDIAITQIYQAGWYDTFARVNPEANPGNTHHGFSGHDLNTSSNTKIDFIFARGAVVTHSSEIIRDYKTVEGVKRYPSDHYFVSADISFAGDTSPAPANLVAIDQTPFAAPSGLAINSGTLFISDSENHNIRAAALASTAAASVFAGGTGSASGLINGTGAAARFDTPLGLAFANGTLHVADSANAAIRKLTSGAAASTFATLGAAPSGIATDAEGNTYVADAGTHAIYKITPAGAVTTLAGNPGASGLVDAAGSAARFNAPRALAHDAAGALYIADTGNNAIRKLVLDTGAVTTIYPAAAGAAPLTAPAGLALGSGTLYIADTGCDAIRALALATGSLTLVAGNPDTRAITYATTTITGANTYVVPATPKLYAADGAGTTARFNTPTALALASGTLYVADTGNAVVRKINLATGAVTTTGTSARIGSVASQILSGSTAPVGTAPQTITITFNAGDGTVSPSTKTAAKGAAYGADGSWPVPARAGYAFAGWWTGAGGTGSQISAATIVPSGATNQTLHAKWAGDGSIGGGGSAENITVTFDPQGGEVSAAGKTVAQGAAYGSLPVASRAGHLFAGWFANPGGTGDQVTAATLVAPAAVSHTLYAKWTASAAAHTGAVESVATSGTFYPEPGIRQIITGGETIAYQFHNTSADPALAAAAARSGVWSYADTRFLIAQGGLSAADGAGILALGESPAGAHPVTFVGKNVSVSVTLSGNQDSLQAVAAGNDAGVYLYGGSLSRTGGGASETVLLNGSATGAPALFHGEDLSILARDSRSKAVTIGGGQASFTLKRGEILSENTTVDGIGVPAFLVNSGSVNRAVTLEDVAIATTSESRAPGLQIHGGLATLAYSGGSITTGGLFSPGVLFLSGNANNGRTDINAFLENITINAAYSAGIDWNFQENYSSVGMPDNQAVLPKPAGAGGAYEIHLANSRVSGALGSIRIAAAGALNAPYAENIRIRLRDTTLDGPVKMTAGLPGGAFPSTTGATLELTGAGATLNGGVHIDGSPAALHPHDAIIMLNGSTISGNIAIVNRGFINATFTDSSINGHYILTGDSGLVARHTRATVASALALADAATAGITLLEGSSILGGITLDGDASATVTLDETSAVSGGISLNENTTLAIVSDGGDTLAGDIAVNGNATLEIQACSAAANIAGNVAHAGDTLRVRGKAAISGTLAITNAGSVLAIADATADSIVLAKGITGSGKLTIESISPAVFGQADIHIIRDATGAMAANALVLPGALNFGTAIYTPERRADGIHLVLTSLIPAIPSGNDLPATTNVDGNATTLSVTMTDGLPCAYQWQVSTDSGANWIDVSGATASSLALTGLDSVDNGKHYRVIITNAAGTIISAPTALAGIIPLEAPTITTPPSNLTVLAGTAATFTVAATGNPAPTYQWQSAPDGTDTWTPIEGATSATLTFDAATLAQNGMKYRCVVTNSQGFVNSAAATLTVNQAPAITTQPSNQSVIEGQNATFSIAVTGNPTPTLQWQSLPVGGSWAPISGETSTTLTVPAATTAQNGTQYRCVATNGISPNAISTVATLTVTSQAFADAQALKNQLESPSTETVTINGTVDLSLVGGATLAPGKTIVGADDTSTITGNLTIPESASGTVILGVNFTGGTLTIDGANDVEVTHCTFADTPVAITGNADNVAFAWNEFTATSGGSGSAMTIANAGASTGILLHNNLWGDGLKSDMPRVTNAQVYMFNNHITATGNTTATVAGAGAQILSVNNLYEGTNNPLTTEPTGKLHASGNDTTTTTGTTATGDDDVFVPAYSHVITPVDTLATLIAANAGNTAGQGSVTPPAFNGTVAISATVTGVGSGTTSVSANVPAMGGFTLTANATGFTPDAWQWYRDNFAIAGATSASYAVTSADKETHAGTYAVALMAATGEIVTSGAFTVTVGELTAPVITTQPASKTIKVGDSTTFSVTATGVGLTYQWKKNGTDIPGATNANLVVTNAQKSDAGNYTVVVTNPAGSKTSNPATLTVNDASSGGGGGGAPSLFLVPVLILMFAIKRKKNIPWE